MWMIINYNVDDYQPFLIAVGAAADGAAGARAPGAGPGLETGLDSGRKPVSLMVVN
jgi:hypothetical protein